MMILVRKGNSQNKFNRGVFVGDEQLAIENGFVKISQEDFTKLCNKELCWNDNGELVPYVKTQAECLSDKEALKAQQNVENIRELKAELAKIKEDIEQEIFGLVRNDYTEKKARAAEIINELRVLEGKEPRKLFREIS